MIMSIGGFAGELVVAVMCVCDKVDAVILLGIDNTLHLRVERNHPIFSSPSGISSVLFLHSLNVIKNQMKEY